jgi:hypothetical protein
MIYPMKIDNPLLKERYESQLEMFRTCLNFMCACCGYTKPKPVGHAGGKVEIYEPRNQMIATNTNPAVYTVCDECLGLPDPERHQKITAFLSRQPNFFKSPSLPGGSRN